jgi:pyruvate,orthophosphate dikinase
LINGRAWFILPLVQRSRGGLASNGAGVWCPRLQPRRRKLLPRKPIREAARQAIPLAGPLVEAAVKKGRAKRAELKIGICGEQGGDPASVDFCYRVGLNYVSCSPYRVPIARLAAAQAAVKAAGKVKK